jgi:hypothetical protein
MMKKVRIIIDADVKKAFSIRSPLAITSTIFIYLNDPDGWAVKGYSFQEVRDKEDILIRLSLPKTIVALCGLPGNLSCAELNGQNVYLNAERWFNGASKSKLELEDYRQYMVTHEIGHILGYDHEVCHCKGCKAPVMMQQTKGLDQCVPNIKVVHKDK